MQKRSTKKHERNTKNQGERRELKSLLFSFSPFLLFLFFSVSSVVPSLAQVGAITSTVFSPDGKRAAVGTYKQVLLYDTVEWKVVGQCVEVEDYARSLTFAPDGVTLAIGSGIPGKSGRVTLWDTAKNTTDRFFGKTVRYSGGDCLSNRWQRNRDRGKG